MANKILTIGNSSNPVDVVMAYGSTVQSNVYKARENKNSSTYSVGAYGQFLMSDGDHSYWGGIPYGNSLAVYT